MGEVAEDYADGSCCSRCGEYFTTDNKDVYTHGYPVLCVSCWLRQPSDQRVKQINNNGLQKAIVGKFH